VATARLGVLVADSYNHRIKILDPETRTVR
jgi:hypothetical protein